MRACNLDRACATDLHERVGEQRGSAAGVYMCSLQSSGLREGQVGMPIHMRPYVQLRAGQPMRSTLSLRLDG